MRTKLRLLPHWCQITGYIYLTVFLICTVYVLISNTGTFPDDNGIIKGVNSFLKFLLYNWNFVGALNFLMIFLAVFSKEKVEDEMTISIRINALIYLVLFLFMIHVLLYLPDGSRISSIIRETKDFMMGDFGVLTIIYAFMYKIMIWVNRWRMGDEE